MEGVDVVDVEAAEEGREAFTSPTNWMSSSSLLNKHRGGWGDDHRYNSPSNDKGSERSSSSTSKQ